MLSITKRGQSNSLGPSLLSPSFSHRQVLLYSVKMPTNCPKARGEVIKESRKVISIFTAVEVNLH